MSFENSAGINVHNHFGPRKTGGTKGNFPSTGPYMEFAVNFDGEAAPLGQKFPVGVDMIVVGIEAGFATGTATKVSIGGVECKAATAAAPVKIPHNNTGVLDVAGFTAGTLVIKYARVKG